MSMAEVIAKITEQFKNLPPEKRRLMVICFVGAILVAIMLRPQSTEQVTASTLPPKEVKTKVGSLSVQPVQKEIISLPAATRDPFAAPSGFEVDAKPEKSPASLQPGSTLATSAAAPVPAANMGNDTVPKDAMPILVGTINDNTTHIAIISYRGTKRSYHIGQMVGSYKLISISDRSAVIQGLQGQQVLTLGR
ncbi:hypothetical protein SRRS_22020 [Sporomusa rhizae]